MIKVTCSYVVAVLCDIHTYLLFSFNLARRFSPEEGGRERRREREREREGERVRE